MPAIKPATKVCLVIQPQQNYQLPENKNNALSS